METIKDAKVHKLRSVCMDSTHSSSIALGMAMSEQKSKKIESALDHNSFGNVKNTL